MCDDFKAQIQYLVYDLWKILIIKENSMKTSFELINIMQDSVET